MAKQAKPKTVSSAKTTTATNVGRPNGKAWKKSWGPSGPPLNVLTTAQEQHSNAKRRVSRDR